jgi:hypothetical protein
MYTPNNPILYNGAVIGAVEGLCVSGKILTNQDPDSYAGMVQVALAVAQAFDSLVPAGAIPPIPLITQLAVSLISGALQDRATVANPKSTDPNTWMPLAKALSALGSQVTSQVGSSLVAPSSTAGLVAYTPAALADWSGTDPLTVETALNRIAVLVGPIP